MARTPVIAIVDDDEEVRSATSSLVRSLGWNAATFGSAEEFLASPTLPQADCLITDVQMPGMNGLELQEQLIAMGRDLPVIIVTAFPEDRFRIRAEKAGAIDFLTKPYDGEVMVRRIGEALQRARP